MNYLNNFFLVGDNFEESLKAVGETTELSSKLDFQLNLENYFLYLHEGVIFRIHFKLQRQDCHINNWETRKPCLIY